MTFYRELASFYDDIYPVTAQQRTFLDAFIGEGSVQVLDIACGNGEHSVALAQKGHLVTALDSDMEMIRRVREKADLCGVEIATLQSAMDKMETCLSGQFDRAICIGNALVHLDTEERVLDFLKQLKKCLKKDGQALLQIMNYERILKQQGMALPTQVNEEKKLTIKRTYTLEEDCIVFDTILEVDGNEQKNTVKLLPLVRERMEQLIKEAGLKVDAMYGDYDESLFEHSESVHCIYVIS